MDSIRTLAAAVPVSIDAQLPSAWRRAPAPFVRCPASHLKQTTFSHALLECLLECLLEILHVVQSPYLLRHRNKAVMALAIRDFRPG